MSRIAALLIVLPIAAAADWIEIRTGPFQIISNADEDRARQTANLLEQLRHVTGGVLGKTDARTTWPVRIVVFRNAREGAARPPELARDAYIASLVAGQPPPRAWLRRMTEILIESNSARLPREIDSGLADFFSTLEADGPRLTLGRPLPEAERNPAWARAHMLQVLPDYYGKMRVLVYNLQRGMEAEPAYRNTFGKGPAEIDKQAAAYMSAGRFEPLETSGSPINPRRDFRVRKLEAPAANLALADLKLVDAARPGDAQAAFQKLLAAAPAAAHEGMALLALRDKQVGEARKELDAAAEAGSASARVWVEKARLESQPGEGALKKAIELNPNWAEPHYLLARRQAQAGAKVASLKTAAELEPRNAGYWRALAEAYLEARNFSEAGKAWAAAENASSDSAERETIRAARRAIEQQRLDHAAAERKRLEEERLREIQRLKEAAMAEVRAAEARANRGAPAPPPDRRVIPWQEGEAPSGKLRGRLVQVDCRRGGASRLTVEDRDRKTVRLAVRDPGKLVVMGTGDLTIGCGAQNPPREVLIEYFPKADPKLASSGEVATLEYLNTRPPGDAPGKEAERRTLPKPN